MPTLASPCEDPTSALPMARITDMYHNAQLLYFQTMSWARNRGKSQVFPCFLLMDRIRNSISNKTLPPARHRPIHAMGLDGEYL